MFSSRSCLIFITLFLNHNKSILKIIQCKKKSDFFASESFILSFWHSFSETVKWIGECVRSNSNFHTRNQDVDFDMLEMFFSFQCTKCDENRWLNTKIFQKRDVIALKRQCLFCTIVTHSVMLCYTAIGHFRWVRWEPRWPWQWVVMTFQVFGGPQADMIFVQSFTQPDSQAKSFTPQKCLNCNIFITNLQRKCINY